VPPAPLVRSCWSCWPSANFTIRELRLLFCLAPLGLAKPSAVNGETLTVQAGQRGNRSSVSIWYWASPGGFDLPGKAAVAMAAGAIVIDNSSRLSPSIARRSAGGAGSGIRLAASAIGADRQPELHHDPALPGPGLRWQATGRRAGGGEHVSSASGAGARAMRGACASSAATGA